METLSNMVGFLFPEFELGWIVNEFRENLTSEFDFTNEARYKKKDLFASFKTAVSGRFLYDGTDELIRSISIQKLDS